MKDYSDEFFIRSDEDLEMAKATARSGSAPSSGSVRHKATATETDESIKRLLGESPYDPAEVVLVQSAFIEGWLACEKAQNKQPNPRG